jgi:hypothetical protein
MWSRFLHYQPLDVLCKSDFHVGAFGGQVAGPSVMLGCYIDRFVCICKMLVWFAAPAEANNALQTHKSLKEYSCPPVKCMPPIPAGGSW